MEFFIRMLKNGVYRLETLDKEKSNLLHKNLCAFEDFFSCYLHWLGQMSFTVDFPAEHVSVGIRSVSACISWDRRGVISTGHVKYMKSGRDNDMSNCPKRVLLLKWENFKKMRKNVHCKHYLKCYWIRILSYIFLELWRRKTNK